MGIAWSKNGKLFQADIEKLIGSFKFQRSQRKSYGKHACHPQKIENFISDAPQTWLIREKAKLR